MSDAHSIRRHFASDNYSGICPEAWAAMQEANTDHEVSYGNDRWTQRASDLLREIFEKDCEVFFVFNGTAANSLALSSLCQSYHSFLCHEMAHIETSECGAPEFFANGTKVLLLPGAHAKIDPKSIARAVKKRTDIHYPKPKALSLTQATELGTVYSLDELRAIHELAREFDYRCKQGGQLASKMRFLSAPWVGLLQEGAWLRHAKHANAMARRLEQALRPLSNIEIPHPVQTNVVFARIPHEAVQGMYRRGWKFYTHVGSADEARLMCSWDTTETDVDAFAADLRELVSKT